MRTLRALLLLAACAAIAFPALALAKVIELTGEAAGDVGVVSLSFATNKAGEPTRILRGNYRLNSQCPQGGELEAVGNIKSTAVKKQGKKLTFKWQGESAPQGTATISGTVSKDGSKATGTISESHNAGAVTVPFVCVVPEVKFVLKPYRG
jgi:hypothetical protein